LGSAEGPEFWRDASPLGAAVEVSGIDSEEVGFDPDAEGAPSDSVLDISYRAPD
jgi:hypothetical protein